jgi:hypothetical protein
MAGLLFCLRRDSGSGEKLGQAEGVLAKLLKILGIAGSGLIWVRGNKPAYRGFAQRPEPGYLMFNCKTINISK